MPALSSTPRSLRLEESEVEGLTVNSVEGSEALHRMVQGEVKNLLQYNGEEK